MKAMVTSRYPEALLEPVHQGQNGLGIGDIPRPQERADGPSPHIEGGTYHHLAEVRSVVLAETMASEALAPGPFEVDGGGVEEHQVDTAEEIQIAIEEVLLDKVLGATGDVLQLAALVEFLADGYVVGKTSVTVKLRGLKFTCIWIQKPQ